jgi:hypothetical protein
MVMPCRHVAFCLDCMGVETRNGKCPICNEMEEGRERVYL